MILGSLKSLMLTLTYMLTLMLIFTLTATEAFTIQHSQHTQHSWKSNTIISANVGNIRHDSLGRPIVASTRLIDITMFNANNHRIRLSVLSARGATKDTISDDDQTTSNGDNDDEPTFDSSMPWSTMQEFVLQDKIPNYLINIPQRLNNPTLQGGGINKTSFCLWHTLRKDVTELMGYDIAYLQHKYRNIQDDQESPPPGMLPYIDDFEFRKNGGIKGRIYGLVGIESGTEIVTSPLKDVELTLPKGFVLTDDGTCAYELGIPKSQAEQLSNNIDIPYSMDLSNVSKGGTKLISDVGQQSGKVAGSVVSELSDPETSQMIVNLGATTAIALGAATAMNMLSHHLTVNVFWV